MNRQRLMIVNARVVNEGRITEEDILVRNGRIEAIGKDLASRKADKVLDADGKHLFPGMIDDHAHFREPGLTHKGDIHIESRAAVAGGITSFMDMPNTRPPTVNGKRLKEKLSIAANTSLANFAFYLGAAADNIEEIKTLDPQTVCGIKVFMGASTGNMRMDDPAALTNIFKYAPILVAVHCEDTSMIILNERIYREKYGENVPMHCHPMIRDEAACFKSSALAVDLAGQFSTRLHVLHLSTKRELSLFSEKNMGENIPDKKITAEACAHHLYFDESDYKEKQALIKCNPAIKTAADKNALINAVKRGKIDVIGTDHAPHTLKEKQQSYFKSPSGMPLAREAFVCVLEHYHQGDFSLPLIAEKTAHAPARLFQVKDRGYIREGYWADLTLVDLNRPHVTNDTPILSKCGWTPFSGRIFSSTIDTVIVSGHLAYHRGVIDGSTRGRPLTFERP